MRILLLVFCALFAFATIECRRISVGRIKMPRIGYTPRIRYVRPYYKPSSGRLTMGHVKRIWQKG